jgi:hypothetical protein
MTIASFPTPAPNRSTDTAQEFSDNMDALLARVVTLPGEMNEAVDAVNTDAAAATAAAAAAAAAASNALSASSFRGSWATLTGPLAVPSSVYHSNAYWMLLQGLADVTTQTPGSAPTYWAKLPSLTGDAVGGINFMKGPDIASAATIDPWAPAQGNFSTVTGAVATGALSAAPLAGASRWLLAGGAWPLTHGVNFLLPGGANYTCSAGDIVHIHAVTTTQFRVNIFRADGNPVVLPGLTYLGTVNFGASPNIDCLSLPSSLYDEFRFSFVNLVPAAATSLIVRTSTNNGTSFDATAGDYYTAGLEYYSGLGGINSINQAGATYFATANNNISSTLAHGGACGELTLFNPGSTSMWKHMHCELGCMQSAATAMYEVAKGVRASTADIDAVRFTTASGANWAAGSVRIYGYRKA